MNKSHASRRFIIASMYSFLVTGAMVLMTSALLTFLMQHYQLKYDQGGLLLSFLAAGSILSNFLSGSLAERIGHKPTLLIAAVCYFLGYAGLTLLPPLWALQGLLLIAGLGWGTFNNLINFLLTAATGGDGRKILAVHTMYSIGAFLAPLALGVAISLGFSWRVPAGLLALLSLLLIIVVLLMPIPVLPQSRKPSARKSYAFLRQWRFYLFMLLLFMYVGTESSYNGWIVSYLVQKHGYPDADAQFLLSVLWVAMIIGRVLIALISSKRRMAWILLLEGVGVTVGAILLIVTGQPAGLTVSVVLIGLSLSACYGMILANASDLVAESSIVSGLMMSLGGLGATLLPLLVGIFAERSGITAGMTFLAVTSGLLMVLAAVNSARYARMKSGFAA